MVAKIQTDLRLYELRVAQFKNQGHYYIIRIRDPTANLHSYGEGKKDNGGI